MRGTLHRQGQLHTLRFERRLPHPPERIWRAITDNSELAHWFPAAIQGGRAAGASLRFVFPNNEGPTLDGRMVVFDPPHTLEYSWGDDILRWELRPEGPETLLVFTHTFPDGAKAAGDAAGWTVCFEAFDRWLAGLPREPYAPDRLEALVSDYSKQFGARTSP